MTFAPLLPIKRRLGGRAESLLEMQVVLSSMCRNVTIAPLPATQSMISENESRSSEGFPRFPDSQIDGYC
jgi:hypothetical protein